MWTPSRKQLCLAFLSVCVLSAGSFFFHLQKAMDWFRARHKDPIFVVTSNGMRWCLENIDTSHGDVVFAGNGQEGTPGKDFALLTQCNHTIMTIGTFGFWAAYLAGGDTVYLANFTLPDSEFLKIFRPKAAFLPEWVGINADLSPLQAQFDPWETDSLFRLA